MFDATHPPQRIAVVGAGAAGLSAAWLLSRRHDVVLYDRNAYPGGHANTVDAVDAAGATVPVDTGFIVYNEANYPNFVALLAYLNVATTETCMSFAASIARGGKRLEYSGQSLSSVFSQRANAFSPRFIRMLVDLKRFHVEARRFRDDPRYAKISLGDFLKARRFSKGFTEDLLAPMAGAIWSTPAVRVLDHPFRSFVEFYDNHGLLQVLNLPVWRSVAGGSRSYVTALLEDYRGRVRLGADVRRIVRDDTGAEVIEADGARDRFDHVVVAAHADEAVRMLDAPDPMERTLLGSFDYASNEAVLHRDAALMPRARKAWSSWNYLSTERDGEARASVSYWMNRLQELPTQTDFFVSVNPLQAPDPEKTVASFRYDHPVIDLKAVAAREELWRVQGVRRVYFCGAHLGHGFHEDAIQSGLAMAEAIGGVRRPWTVENESGRITLGPLATSAIFQAAE